MRSRRHSQLRQHPSAWAAPALAATGLLLLVGTLQACALVESAAEVTVGKGQLPAIDVTFALPAPDELLGSAMPGGGDAQPVTGVPVSFDAVTLGHIQGLLGLSGRCQHQYTLVSETDTRGGVDGATDGDGTDEIGAGDLQIELLSCPTGGWCAAWCGEQTGLLIRFGVDMVFVDADRASNIREQLSADVGDAIAQVRLRFFRLTLRAGGGLDAPATTALIDSFDIDLVDESGHRARVIDKSDLDRMASGVPLRTEVPPDSAFTEGLRDGLKNGQAIRVRVEATLSVAQGDLLAWPVTGTEMSIAIQPEIVLSTVSLATGLL